MSFRVFGQVRESENRNGIPDLVVQALDAQDFLGEVTTDQNGSFSLEYGQAANKEWFRTKRDIYLVVKNSDGEILKTNKESVSFDPNTQIEINVDIPHPALLKAGLVRPVEEDERRKTKIADWTWRSDYDRTDNLAQELQKELTGKSSVLELLKSYIAELKGDFDNNAAPFIKLAKLFDLGITPEVINGHFYGIPVAIKTGDQSGLTAHFGNVLGVLWGATVSDVCPWVGKSFSPLQADQLESITATSQSVKSPASLGINHFNKIEFSPLNIASFNILDWWMGLENVSAIEQAAWGHEKDGGNFVAAKAPSIYPSTKRQVLQLNYRWEKLGNPHPFNWLIDELVQVADGLYLGQLLLAGKDLNAYDPKQPSEHYAYQRFGFFVLFDERWNAEARRLFSYLEIPATAPGVRKSNTALFSHYPKYSLLTLEVSPTTNYNSEVFDQIYNDLKNKPTIMHLLKDYSDELRTGLDNESPYFLRLQELFNRGIGVKEMNGFYRGALISWHTEGLWKLMDLNVINKAWMQLGRFFSPWTGKSFDKISAEKLKELTDGYETGKLPTLWGANTQALRTPKEKFVGKLMNLAGVWSENASAQEALELGYDLRCFFFIARQAKSISEQSKNKTIFQFNYRWPKLKTIPPDCYCIDEIVQIAEGLYLGQLMYATDWLKPYDPLVNPAEYKYRSFGYFLLMDEHWHQIRLDIGFDLENI